MRGPLWPFPLAVLLPPQKANFFTAFAKQFPHVVSANKKTPDLNPFFTKRVCLLDLMYTFWHKVFL